MLNAKIRLDATYPLKCVVDARQIAKLVTLKSAKHSGNLGLGANVLLLVASVSRLAKQNVPREMERLCQMHVVNQTRKF